MMVLMGYSCHSSKNAITPPDKPIKLMYGSPRTMYQESRKTDTDDKQMEYREHKKEDESSGTGSDKE